VIIHKEVKIFNCLDINIVTSNQTAECQFCTCYIEMT